MGDRVRRAAPLRPLVRVPPVRRGAGRPPNVDGDETRRRVLDAAIECFATYGYAATTNRLIADRGGLTAASVYHHFGRKDQLMQAAFEDAMRRVADRMRAELEPCRSLQERLDAVFEATHVFVVEAPSLVALVFVALQESRRQEELARLGKDRSLRALFDEIAAAAVQDGELDPEDVPMFRQTLTVLVAGLASMSGQLDHRAHRAATDGYKRLVAGDLLRLRRRGGRVRPAATRR